MRQFWLAFLEGLASLAWSEFDEPSQLSLGSLGDDWSAVIRNLRTVIADFEKQ
jgi:hypothetical protein